MSAGLYREPLAGSVLVGLSVYLQYHNRIRLHCIPINLTRIWTLERRAGVKLPTQKSAAIFLFAQVRSSTSRSMPRENRKRGKHAKDAEELSNKKYRQPSPKVVEPEPTVVEASVTTGEEKTWPPLDPDTKAYFLGVNDRILELEDLGVGRVEAREEDEEDGEDRRAFVGIGIGRGPSG
jgi:hypothetical protein